MITIETSTDADKHFVEICCGIKKLPFSIMQKEKNGQNSSQSLPALSYNNTRIIGCAAIALSLELMQPTPSLFPNGNIGMPLGLLPWRKSMLTLSKEKFTLQANANLIERQLSDGRAFLQGNNAGLADAVSASWLAHYKLEVPISGILQAWVKRLEGLAEQAQQPGQKEISTNDLLAGMQSEPLLDINSNDKNKRTVTCMLD